MPRLSPHSTRFLLTVLAGLAVPALAPAQLQWDGGLTGTAAGGNGTWTASNAVTNWFNGTTDTFWDSNIAVFGGTAGTVMIDAVSPPSATGLMFSTTGYTLASGGGAITLTGTPTITLNLLATETATINAPIASTVGLTKDGAGILILGGASSYSGTTTVSVGTLRAGIANAFSSSSDYSLANTAGVVLDLNGLNQTIGSLAGGGSTGGNVTLGAGNLTVGNANDTTFGGQITGTGRLIKTGNGKLVLSNNASSPSTGSTFSGGLTINGGIVEFAGEPTATAGNGSPIGVVPASATPGLITLDNGGTLRSTKNGTAGTSFVLANRGIQVNSGGGKLDVSLGTSTLAYSGIIAGSTGSISKEGAGALTLSGANTFGSSNGTVTVNGGTLTLTGNNSYNGGITINSGTTLSFSGESSATTGNPNPLGATLASTVANYITINGGKLSSTKGNTTGGTSFVFAQRGITISNGATIESTDTSNLIGELLAASVIAGTGGLTKSGGGNIRLNAGSANTYTGNTTISAGGLGLNATATFGDGTGTVFLSGGNIFSANSRPNAPVANPISMNANTLIWSTSSLTGTSNRTLPFSTSSFSAAANTTLSLANFSPATTTFGVRFTGAITIARPITFGGTLGSTTAAGGVQLELYNEGATADQTFSGNITGTGKVVRSSVGTGTGANSILSGTNTYTGGTDVNGGYIGLGSDSAGSPVVTSGPLGTGTLTFGGTGSSDDPTVGLYASGGAHTVGNAISFGTMTNVTIKGANDLTLSGNVALGSLSRTLTVSNAGVTTLSGQISGGNAGTALTKAGAGTLVLTGPNTYAGATSLNAGTVNFAALNNLGTGAITFNGGTLQYATGNTADISTRTVTISAGGATIDTNGNNVTLANAIGNGGSGGLTKAGAGTLTLQAANTYTGPTVVTAGTLSLGTTGSLASSAITVGTSPGSTAVLDASGVFGGLVLGSGKTLGGHGTVMGDVAVNGTVAPGGSIGTLSLTGNMVWFPGGSLTLEHKADPATFGGANPVAGTDNDVITSPTGTLNTGNLGANSFTINLVPTNPPPAGTSPGPVTYTIATFGAITQSGNLTNLFNVTGAYDTSAPATVTSNGTVLTITFTPVPEPAHALLACGLLSGAAGWWRRRRA